MYIDIYIYNYNLINLFMLFFYKIANIETNSIELIFYVMYEDILLYSNSNIISSKILPTFTIKRYTALL